MDGKLLCLWFALFALLLEGSVAQEHDASTTETILIGLPFTEPTEPTAKPAAEPVTETAAEHAVESPEPEENSERLPQPEVVAEPPFEPEPLSETAAEHDAETKPEAEPEPEVAAEPQAEPTAVTEAEPEVAATPEPEPAFEAEPEPAAEPTPEAAAEPETKSNVAPSESDSVDYQNDAAATPAVPGQSYSSVASATKPNPSLEMNCYSCSSYANGKCDKKPSGQMSCGQNSKEGCYTLIKSDTKLIMRGCISELSEEGDKYCRKEPKHCNLCNDELCNKDAAPPVAASGFRIIVNTTLWALCVLGLKFL